MRLWPEICYHMTRRTRKKEPLLTHLHNLAGELKLSLCSATFCEDGMETAADEQSRHPWWQSWVLLQHEYQGVTPHYPAFPGGHVLTCVAYIDSRRPSVRHTTHKIVQRNSKYEPEKKSIKEPSPELASGFFWEFRYGNVDPKVWTRILSFFLILWNFLFRHVCLHLCLLTFCFKMVTEK